MSEGNNGSTLRDRLASSAEEHLGQALSDILESSLLTGAISRAFDVRERAVQAQELAMGLLNLPSAADIERLTRRLRSVSQRLETIEDALQRIERNLKELRTLAQAGVQAPAPATPRRAPARASTAAKGTKRTARSAGAAAKSSAARKGASTAAQRSSSRKGA